MSLGIFPSILWNGLRRIRINILFLMCLVEFTCEAPSGPGLVCRIFKNYEFSFTSSELLIQMTYFFSIHFWWAVYSFPLQYSCLKIPWIEEPAWLQSMGCRVSHDWASMQQYGLSSGALLGHFEMTAVSCANDKGSRDLVEVKLRE